MLVGSTTQFVTAQIHLFFKPLLRMLLGSESADQGAAVNCSAQGRTFLVVRGGAAHEKVREAEG